ncbi:coiled-coil domain-containing protein 58 [Lentinula edodes]|uniref:Coiled-coil domain-containing protein 58 n=1 Tax=Lentinula edodes TaxID=5353 RepID=A0A1Q3EDP7_LENED|nr:coiled-coil domain-containing protein 58 [Lentinula edodes]
MFKAVLRSYRGLDDTINMRLNRTAAFMHDQERQKVSRSKLSAEEQACSRLWQELVSNWSRRKELIEYCVGVVDKSNEEKQEIVDSQTSSPSEVRKARAEKYSQEVKRDQIHKELSVETIVKQRSIDVFRSRYATQNVLLDAMVDVDIKVPVTLGVMSRCPDALLCENSMDAVLKKVGEKIDLKLVYIAKINSSEPDFGATCMHGPEECAGNVQQLCAAKYSPFANWWEFVHCNNYEDWLTGNG